MAPPVVNGPALWAFSHRFAEASLALESFNPGHFPVPMYLYITLACTYLYGAALAKKEGHKAHSICHAVASAAYLGMAGTFITGVH